VKVVQGSECTVGGVPWQRRVQASALLGKRLLGGRTRGRLVSMGGDAPSIADTTMTRHAPA
jgi:hypothetical protein